MTSLAADPLALPASSVDTGAAELTVVGLAEAEAEWRRFERDAIATPYGRFDWVRAFAGRDADRVRVVTGRNAEGRLDLVWALQVVRRFGVTAALPIGGRHANVNLPLIRPGTLGSLPPKPLLQGVGAKLGADLVCIPRVPETWADMPVPLASLGRPNPDVAPSVRLGADPESTAQRTMSNEARKRLRNKERGLAKHGPVAFRQAQAPGEIDGLLHAFFRQKAERFAALGIADPFAGAPIRDAIRQAATGSTPAIALYGLWIGETIAAVLGAAVSETHLSGMFISFEHWPDILRFSPGDVLMSRVVQAQFGAGRARLDFGTGRAHYKSIFCDEEIGLRDVVHPVTALGTAAAAGLRATLAAKARLKGSPAFMAAVGRVRRARPTPSF